MKRSDPCVWTIAHQNEALRRTYEIAAIMAARGDVGDPRGDSPGAHQARAMGGYPAATEVQFRQGLATWACFDGKRIDREVLRVRALAEGRLVRMDHWIALDTLKLMHDRKFYGDGAEDKARARAREYAGIVVVRVSRIKRAGK